MTKRTEFEFEGKAYCVTHPSIEERQQAKIHYQKMFSVAIKNGAFLNSQILDVAKECGLWDQKKEQELNSIETELRAIIKRLDKGGYAFEEAVDDAVKAKELRSKIYSYNLLFADLASHSAERQAEMMEQDYLLFCTLKKDNGRNRVYKSFEEFLDKKDEDDLILYATLSMGANNNAFKELPENQFLIEFNRMNDNLQLLDDEGNPIDLDGNPVEIDEAKEEKVERKPFLDKKGKPIKKKEPKEEECAASAK